MSQSGKRMESKQVVKFSSTTTYSQSSWQSTSSSITTKTAVSGSGSSGLRHPQLSIVEDSILRAPRLTNTSKSSETYTPVYARTATGTAIGTTGNQLFYTFPKSANLQPNQTQPQRTSNIFNRDAQSTTPTLGPPNTALVSQIPRPLPVSKYGDDVYLQSYLKSRRLVYILNHYSYDKKYQTTRDGSMEDVKRLKKTFDKFNVTIKERHDRKKGELMKMAKDQAAKNYKGFDFLIFIIMTHGGPNKTLAARDEMYNLEGEFIHEMQKNKSWAGVPKVFITQACRGNLQTDATTVNILPPSAPNDTLKLFSTYEGFVSYRTSNGTIFIQELCSKLEQYGETDELMTIMRRVTQEVSKTAPTPEQSSTLQKSLYLGKLK